MGLFDHESTARHEAERYHKSEFDRTGDAKHINWLIREECNRYREREEQKKAKF